MNTSLHVQLPHSSPNFKRRGLEPNMASKLIDPSFYIQISFTVRTGELLHFST